MGWRSGHHRGNRAEYRIGYCNVPGTGSRRHDGGPGSWAGPSSNRPSNTRNGPSTAAGISRRVTPRLSGNAEVCSGTRDPPTYQEISPHQRSPSLRGPRTRPTRLPHGPGERELNFIALSIVIPTVGPPFLRPAVEGSWQHCFDATVDGTTSSPNSSAAKAPSTSPPGPPTAPN